MKITSSAFDHQGSIPPKYTCDGSNISPPLEFHDVPSAAKSLALIVDDPDVPERLRADRNWDHWVVWNIPPATAAIGEAARPDGVVGRNTWGANAYGGPAPPDREHRYFFKLYALDTVLPDLGHPTKAKLEAAMEGHVLARAQIMGTYQKKQ